MNIRIWVEDNDIRIRDEEGNVIKILLTDFDTLARDWVMMNPTQSYKYLDGIEIEK